MEIEVQGSAAALNDFLKDLRRPPPLARIDTLFTHDLPPHSPDEGTFVIAETGMSGPEEKHPRALALMKAQAAVAEREEFKGNVAFVGTKAFWRPQEKSPSAQGYHWNSNAETYYLIGKAMAEATKGLIGVPQ